MICMSKVSYSDIKNIELKFKILEPYGWFLFGKFPKWGEWNWMELEKFINGQKFQLVEFLG